MSNFDTGAGDSEDRIRVTYALGYWEKPRNIAIMLATVAVLAGVVGFKLGQMPAPAMQIQFPTHITVQLEQSPGPGR